VSVLLISTSTLAGWISSVPFWLLLPLSPPPVLSTVVVVMLATLVYVRGAGGEASQLGRTTMVTVCVSPLFMLPMGQLSVKVPAL